MPITEQDSNDRPIDRFVAVELRLDRPGIDRPIEPGHPAQDSGLANVVGLVKGQAGEQPSEGLFLLVEWIDRRRLALAFRGQ